MSELIIILCTVPNEDFAQNLASEVVSKHLVACVTIFPNIKSIYYWKSKIIQKNEVQMILKTNKTNQQELFNYLKFNHPYQIPEILSLPIIYGDKDYLSWIRSYLN